MAYSDEEKRDELKRLADFLDSVEIAAEVIEKGAYAEDISLLISLPSVEDLKNITEEEAAERLHLASGHLVDIEEPEIIKYLSLYTQVRADLTGLDELSLLRLMNRMNQGVRVGHFFYGEAEPGNYMVQYRASVTGAAEEPLDEGVVANAVLEMGIGYDSMKDALMRLRESEGEAGE